MRRPALLVAAACALLASAIAAGGLLVAGSSSRPAAVPAVGPAQVSTDRYVALGDSVPYGEGLSNPGSGVPPGAAGSDQGPSTSAYPSIVASRLGLRMAVRTRGCPLTGSQLAVSGAPASVGPGVILASSSGRPCSGPGTSVEQTEVPAARLGTDPARLVTVQVGADDLGFSGCLLHELTDRLAGGLLAPACTTGGRVVQVGGVPKLVGGRLAPIVASRLDHLRTALTAIIDQVAPHAGRVAVLDYYQPIPAPADFSPASVSRRVVAGGTAQVDVNLVCAGLALNRDAAYADARFLQQQLDQTIREAVASARAGAGAGRVTLVDIGQAFRGHEMCTRSPDVLSGEWMPRAKLAGDVAVAGASKVCILGACLRSASSGAAAIADLHEYVWRAAHPNAAGQRRIADAVVASLSGGAHRSSAT